MPGSYPNYTSNIKSTKHDIPGRQDIMNGSDYNDHDTQILIHQSNLIEHDVRITILENNPQIPDLSTYWKSNGTSVSSGHWFIPDTTITGLLFIDDGTPQHRLMHIGVQDDFKYHWAGYGSDFVINSDSSLGSSVYIGGSKGGQNYAGPGGSVYIYGGSGGGGFPSGQAANGGNVILYGGAPQGTGVSGCVKITDLVLNPIPPMCSDNSDAIASGLAVGHLYRSGGDPDQLYIVH